MFAGLIFAKDDSVDGGSLVATLPFAGATLLETQIARVIEAGASRAFVVAGRVTAELSAAIDRVARAGHRAELIREPGELAEALTLGEAVMVVADGVIASAEVHDAMVRAPVPALLAVAQAPGDTRLERIDAQDHWAGIAMIDATLLERTVAALGEWDLQSTLLRRAAQEGAARRYLSGSTDAGDHALIVSARQAQDVDAVRMRVLIEGEGRVAERIVSRWIAQPLARLARTRSVSRRTIAAGAVAAALGGAGAFAAGWGVAGALLLLVSAIGAATARIAALHAFDDGAAAVGAWIGEGVALIGAVAVAGTAGATLGAGTIAALVLARRAHGERWRWAPTPVTILLLLVAGLIAGTAWAGLAAVALHATVTLGVAIERLRGGKQG